ncbi:hypothetical protein AB6A40_003987 [Gnathostoma spinigerum]|uniref:Reverse transcriptase domain-containing protein n=1 Tax=Gnathostoma spinigerum TaxID=75299 RepID=A0ABD6EJY1_9BILA
MNHIFVLNQMIETAREYWLPLCLLFVDYEKAFDNAEINAVMNTLKSQGVEDSYIKILVEANSGYTTDINVFGSPIKIPIAKGVRQGDTISPKLFAACLESVFRKISWRGGVNINGDVLTHLRFADDIVILAKDIQTAQEMLLQLNEESRAAGLKVNIPKTKCMRSDEGTLTPIQLDGEVVEEVNSFTCLGQVLNMHHKTNEGIGRRCMAGWRAFNSMKEFLEKLSKPEDRALLFSSTVVPSMLYGSETWSLTKSEEHQLAVTESAMERRLLKIKKLYHVRNEDIRQRTRVVGVVLESIKSKLRWPGHVARLKDDRWTKKVNDWYPRNHKKPVGRSRRRWNDLMSARLGPMWRRTAHDLYGNV